MFNVARYSDRGPGIKFEGFSICAHFNHPCHLLKVLLVNIVPFYLVLILVILIVIVRAVLRVTLGQS